MTTKILAFAGHKQSGKSTSCNFLHGYQLRAHHIVDQFAVTEKGDLVINTAIIDSEGKEETSQAILDTSRDDVEFEDLVESFYFKLCNIQSGPGTLKK